RRRSLFQHGARAAEPRAVTRQTQPTHDGLRRGGARTRVAVADGRRAGALRRTGTGPGSFVRARAREGRAALEDEESTATAALARRLNPARALVPGRELATTAPWIR